MDIQITPQQIELMKHAIGFKQDKVKRGKYIAWRNYFVATNPNDEWDIIVKNGLAVKRFKDNQIVYFVSKEGMNLLARMLSIKIVEGED